MLRLEIKFQKDALARLERQRNRPEFTARQLKEMDADLQIEQDRRMRRRVARWSLYRTKAMAMLRGIPFDSVLTVKFVRSANFNRGTAAGTILDVPACRDIVDLILSGSARLISTRHPVPSLTEPHDRPCKQTGDSPT